MGLWNHEVKAFISSFFPWNLENGVRFVTADCAFQPHAVKRHTDCFSCAVVHKPCVILSRLFILGEKSCCVFLVFFFFFKSPKMKVLYRETAADDSSSPVRINGTN